MNPAEVVQGRLAHADDPLLVSADMLRDLLPKAATGIDRIYFRGEPGFVEPRTVREQIADHRRNHCPPHWWVAGVHLVCCPCRWIDEPGRVKHNANSEWPDW